MLEILPPMKNQASNPSAKALRIHPDDSVAVLVEGGAIGHPLQILTEADERKFIEINEPVSVGHKVAIQAHAVDAPIIKFGVRIGHATQPIKSGDWVHLHNCSSDVDDRSNELDPLTGVPADTCYE